MTKLQRIEALVEPGETLAWKSLSPALIVACDGRWHAWIGYMAGSSEPIRQEFWSHCPRGGKHGDVAGNSLS